MTKSQILIASFLHDIGKPIERCENFTLSEDLKESDTKYPHPKYSAQLLKVLKTEKDKYKIPYFQKILTDDVINLVLFHHNPQNIYQKIIQLADWLSSAERIKDETDKVPLLSIFNQISISNPLKAGREKEDYQYQLFPLDFDKIFPEKQGDVDKNLYKNCIEDFLSDLKYVNDFEKLYYLFEKYFCFVPAQTWKSSPDISLFDHSKTTSAIAVCLYEDISHNFNETDIDKALENNGNSNKKAFILIGGDLSGIQNFIFNIPSKGAARSLKGRSVYLELLTRYIARYIFDRLDLPITNLLYNGGGNFYILAPYNAEELLSDIRKEIVGLLLETHKGQLYVAISWTQLTPSELKNFPEAQRNLTEKIGELKSKKWSEIGIENNYNKIFGPIDQGSRDGGYCRVCGSSFNLIHDEEGNTICRMCDSFKKLTDKVKKAKFMIERKTERFQGQYNTYNDIFHKLGYEIDFIENPTYREDNIKIYKLNDFDFHEYDGFLLGSYNLPNKEFEEIAKTSGDGKELGDNKLAYLKLDIDNLGRIFVNGLGENKSFSRIATLSRMLVLYFEGYINQLIKKKGLEESLYVVFSGGDDTFIIGSWDKILCFLDEFHKDFERLVAYNPDVTLSAGIGIFDAHYPVIRGSVAIEEKLDKAKTFLYKEEENAGEEPHKNKLTIFDEVFNWEEYGYILKIWEYLKELIINNGESRAILQKVIRSSKGLNKLLEDANRGKIQTKKVWRLAYYLRDMKSKEDKDKLVDTYEDMILKNIFEKEKIRNPTIIQVSARLAELSTKKKEEK